jgi:hypothetical protein
VELSLGDLPVAWMPLRTSTYAAIRSGLSNLKVIVESGYTAFSYRSKRWPHEICRYRALAVKNVPLTRVIARGGVSGALPLNISIFSCGSALAALPTYEAQTLFPIFQG